MLFWMYGHNFPQAHTKLLQTAFPEEWKLSVFGKGIVPWDETFLGHTNRLSMVKFHTMYLNGNRR